MGGLNFQSATSVFPGNKLAKGNVNAIQRGLAALVCTTKTHSQSLLPRPVIQNK